MSLKNNRSLQRKNKRRTPTLVNWQELTLQANNSVNEWTARQALMIMMMLRKIKNAKTTEANLSFIVKISSSWKHVLVPLHAQGQTYKNVYRVKNSSVKDIT